MRQLFLDRDSFAIGRAADNDAILDDPRVSRHHARIDRRDGVYYVVDLGSANGTHLNGEELEPKQPARLNDAGEVRISGFHILFREADEVAVPTAIEAREAQTIVPSRAAPARPRLEVTAGASTSEFTLEKDVQTLGRDPSNDIVIDDPKVSRRHAELRRGAWGYEIVDAGSANGILFGGKKIAQRLLEGGDVLRIGAAVSLTYRSFPGRIREAAAPPPSVVELREDTRVTVGRDPGNTLALDHPLVAGRQIAIVKRGGQVFVQDDGAGSETFVNAQPLARGEVRPLRPGDVVRVGPAKLVVAEDSLHRVVLQKRKDVI